MNLKETYMLYGLAAADPVIANAMTRRETDIYSAGSTGKRNGAKAAAFKARQRKKRKRK